MPNFSVTPSEAPNIPRDGLLFWFDPIYQSNRESPQTSYDRSGNYGHITFSNSPTILPATDSLSGLDFDGTNDNILTPINSPPLSQVTWVLWLRREASQVAYAGIFYNRVPGRSDNVAGLHFANTGTTANRLRFTYNNSNFDTESSLIPPLNSWVMISCALDSTGATYSMFGSGSSTINSRMAITSHTSLTFTHSWIAYDGFSSRYFAGSIGLCLFYNRVLSSGDLDNIYRKTRFRFERLSGTPGAGATGGGAGVLPGDG
ncbi:hypothetical protein EBU71_02580 [bacterium]|nr:hypothetical protein [Candidatus Elulimicrobium humile]